MITKHTVRSCCGKLSYIFQTQKPVTKGHIADFEQAGFVAPPHYQKAGLFFVQKKGFVATAAYGSTKIQVTVSNNSKVFLTEFETVLNRLIHA